jgi:hypothetical protein
MKFACGLRSAAVAILYFAVQTAYAGEDRTVVRYEEEQILVKIDFSCV